LAGLAAATTLAAYGFQVELLESRDRLGGRAGSFTDAATGQLVDACQHVSMGCCTAFADFCRTVGIDHLLRPAPVLYFMTPDRRVSRFRADPWPAPFHLARSFLSAHFLSPLDKLRIGWGLSSLHREPEDADPPFGDWLKRHGQTTRTVERFWGVVLTSALNEAPDRVGLKYARKVFVDAFLTDRTGFEVQVPAVPLGRLYGEELKSWLAEHGVRLRLQTGVLGLTIVNNRVKGVALRGNETLAADWYISAVPFDRLLELLPAAAVSSHACFSRLHKLETSPITSVHVWYDRPIMRLPHVVLVGCVGQWVFNRGQTTAGEHYLQVVVSASRQFQGQANAEVQRLVLAELATLFPAVRAARLQRARVVREHVATFSALPGVDQFRPGPATPIENLVVAGDWTATGWPATMEGAVRSGFRAAEAVLRASGAGPDLSFRAH
jgi:squalene-associated FAD-dependent desaturase